MENLAGTPKIESGLRREGERERVEERESIRGRKREVERRGEPETNQRKNAFASNFWMAVCVCCELFMVSLLVLILAHRHVYLMPMFIKYVKKEKKTHNDTVSKWPWRDVNDRCWEYGDSPPVQMFLELNKLEHNISVAPCWCLQELSAAPPPSPRGAEVRGHGQTHNSSTETCSGCLTLNQIWTSSAKSLSLRIQTHLKKEQLTSEWSGIKAELDSVKEVSVRWVFITDREWNYPPDLLLYNPSSQGSVEVVVVLVSVLILKDLSVIS